jgi:hypothetical protein
MSAIEVSEVNCAFLGLDVNKRPGPDEITPLKRLASVFILDINRALDIFENVSVLGYADDLKLLMTIKCIGDCQLFQRDLDRWGKWCRSNEFDLNTGKCKSISFRNMRPIEFVYLINETAQRSKGLMRSKTLE